MADLCQEFIENIPVCELRPRKLPHHLLVQKPSSALLILSLRPGPPLLLLIGVRSGSGIPSAFAKRSCNDKLDVSVLDRVEYAVGGAELLALLTIPDTAYP